MKDINEMSYEELLNLEELIKDAKSKFYDVSYLYVVEDCICFAKVKGNYSFLGSQTPVEYYDLFSGKFIAAYYIFASIPKLNKVLNDYDISHKRFMSKNEIKEIWEQYKGKMKVLKKQ